MSFSSWVLANVGKSRKNICVIFLSVALMLLYSIYYRLCVRSGGKYSRRSVRRTDGLFKRSKIRFDRTLFRRVRELLRICFPRILCVESAMVILLGTLIMFRTTLTLTFARVLGEGGKALVQKDFKRFAFSVADTVVYAIPATATTFGITYTKSAMEQRFRERVQSAIHQEYFEGHKMYHLAMRNFVDNPAHRVTNDVRCFCRELATLFSAVIKPVMDIIIFSSAFVRLGGYGAPLLLTSYYVFVAFLLRALLPNFAGLIARSREKKGNLCVLHTQLVQHAEEVSFYHGEDVERENADQSLRLYIRQEHLIKKAKWWASLLNTILVRDGATCVGYIVCSLIVCREKNRLDAAQLAQLFIRSTQLFIPLSMAVGKLLLLHLKVGALCGSAHRVGELRDVLRDMDHDKQGNTSNTIQVADNDEITFSDVTFVSPDDQIVLSNFTTTFKRGRHVMIIGHNGSGKTALLRSLCGLWPLQSGMLKRPDLSHLFFLTQRTYLPPGNLRTQFIYPAVEEEELTRGLSDDLLLQLAADVGLSGVVEREGGLDAEKNWFEVFSGGERQRVALIRALYNKPVFLFLDECTGAISQDIELLLYELLQRHGITLVTVSHHVALKFLHQQIVRMDGVGGYTIQGIEELQ